ncbi:hypothetical protein [Aquimarina litoralis]|uniref:hypothetical protein n=1 Tax=Aquimarina litoralis TaxID=584605 RepID=UPI001C5620A0|nr:hypothetical protein [Aquimarina litoralis]
MENNLKKENQEGTIVQSSSYADEEKSIFMPDDTESGKSRPDPGSKSTQEPEEEDDTQ